jgi:hypothetical protein
MMSMVVLLNRSDRRRQNSPQALLTLRRNHIATVRPSDTAMRDAFKIALFFLAIAAAMTLVVAAAQCHGGVP